MSDGEFGNGGAPKSEPNDNGGGVWYESLPDDLKEVAATKGWKDPSGAVASYKHLESVMGADKAGRALMLPKSEDDAEGFDKIYQALGRPESHDGYGLNEFFGDREVDGELVGAMSEVMHKAGLSTRQAQELAKSYSALELARLEADNQAFEAELREVKANYSPQQLELARQGYVASGLPDGMQAEIESRLGPKLAADIFGAIGRLTAQAKMPGDAKGGSLGGGDPKAKVDQLMADPLFLKRYLAGEKSAISQVENLFKMAVDSDASAFSR